jgi:hypothetical protein
MNVPFQTFLCTVESIIIFGIDYINTLHVKSLSYTICALKRGRPLAPLNIHIHIA